MTKDELFVKLFEIVRWDYEEGAERYPIPFDRDVGRHVRKLLQAAKEHLPKPGELDCSYACGYVEPYGWVPEAGCPIHDPEG